MIILKEDLNLKVDAYSEYSSVDWISINNKEQYLFMVERNELEALTKAEIYKKILFRNDIWYRKDGAVYTNIFI